VNENIENSLREARNSFKYAEPLDAWLNPVADAKKPLRAKVFKSGNSMALRLPAALGLEAGMEMTIMALPDGSYSLKAVDAPKRKFNIAKVAGCAKGSGLQLLKPEDREFVERRLLWDDVEWRAKHVPE
jgi:antitoxin VapB